MLTMCRLEGSLATDCQPWNWTPEENIFFCSIFEFNYKLIQSFFLKWLDLNCCSKQEKEKKWRLQLWPCSVSTFACKCKNEPNKSWPFEADHVFIIELVFDFVPIFQVFTRGWWWLVWSVWRCLATVCLGTPWTRHPEWRAMEWWLYSHI